MTPFTSQRAIFLLSLLLPCTAAAAGAEQQYPQQQEHDLVHRRAIIGGSIADPTRFPYYVRLDYEGVFGCGGSLITREFVLTAAHCAFPSDVSIITAVVGGSNVTNTTSGVSRAVLNRYLHVAYDDFISVSNDVALLKIEPIPDDLNITMVQFKSRRDFLQPGDSVTVIGLGATETEESADQLRQVELKIVNETTCDEQYSGAIHRKSMLCAADPGEDSCQGDSGGPMMVLGATAMDDVQVGVVSWGAECGSAEKPGVYADVAYLQSWIETMVCKHSENPPEGCEVTLETETGPYILNPDVDVCRDFSGAFYAGWWHQFRRCDWLREGGRINWY
jgi:secreted trypsin-like serine protease